MGKRSPKLFSSRAPGSLNLKMGDELEANRQPRVPARRIIALLSRTYHSALCELQTISENGATLLLKMYKMVLQAVGPKAGGKPDSHTVVWALFAFLFFLLFASLAVRFPIYSVKVAFVTISSLLICALSVVVWRDFATASDRVASASPTTNLTAPREYRRNLGNSIFTVLFTMILLTVVYSRAWYHDLNIIVLQVQEDILV